MGRDRGQKINAAMPRPNTAAPIKGAASKRGRLAATVASFPGESCFGGGAADFVRGDEALAVARGSVGELAAAFACFLPLVDGSSGLRAARLPAGSRPSTIG